MIEFSQVTVLIVAEIMVALLVISGVLVFFTLLRKGRIRKAVQQLTERVRNDKTKRSERLKRLLGERYGYAGAELEQALHNIMQSEMQLYQNIINGSLKDDHLFVQQVDVDVENLVLAYQNLRAAPATPVVSDEEASELQRLQEENERLSGELRVTMDTMGRMLNEYSTMFADGLGDTPKQEAPKSSSEGDGDSELLGTAVTDHLPANDTYSGMDTEDIDIPPYQAEQTEHSDLSNRDDESSGLMDDEVSEIIGEVMEMADELTPSEQPKEVEPPIGESLMDELEKVDIEIPEMENDALETDDSPAGSLEDEWAKLLEEDAAASKSDKKPQA